jgi:phosphohistidine phosphatase
MRLMLMRHANTEDGQEKEDFQRVLTELGKTEAAQAADFLHEHQIDKVLVSFVKRTMQTSKIIEEKASVKEIEIVTELYEGGEDAIINLLASQEDHNKHLLVIGHNPLIYNVAMSLSKNDSPEYNELIATAMPTARIIIIDFREINSWGKIRNQKGDIIEIFTPKL